MFMVAVCPQVCEDYDSVCVSAVAGNEIHTELRHRTSPQALNRFCF
jgi:hypothetical protein